MSNNGNITVLADETLGGVLREYRQVERTAKKGEKIEIVAIHPESIKKGVANIGDIFTAGSVDSEGDIWSVVEKDFHGIISVNWDGLREYVVLEPTDVVQIDGLRFQMIERKANVGERLIVTEIAYKHSEDETLRVGQVGICTKVLGGAFEGSIDTDLEHSVDGYLNHERVEYNVLVPIFEIPQVAHAEDSPHSLRKDLDNLESGVAEDIAELRERIAALEAKVFAGKIPTEPVSVPKPPQQIRDEIVERAKADVKKISEDIYGDSKQDAFEDYGTPGHIKVTFKVDHKKRTVVALLGLRHCGNHIYARGIAKTAPNDVFNAHIGKAIALRRALGLEVPAEYLNVPNPTEIRVGDVVEESYGRGPVHAIRPTHRTVGQGAGLSFVSADKGLTYINDNGVERWTRPEYVKIIDDTREGAEQSASSTKGASAA